VGVRWLSNWRGLQEIQLHLLIAQHSVNDVKRGLIVDIQNLDRKEMAMGTNLVKPAGTTSQIISIKVRRVNDLANRLQSKQEWPMLVRDLHAEVLKAVMKKQTHIEIDWHRWQTILNLAK